MTAAMARFFPEVKKGNKIIPEESVYDRLKEAIRISGPRLYNINPYILESLMLPYVNYLSVLVPRITNQLNPFTSPYLLNQKNFWPLNKILTRPGMDCINGYRVKLNWAEGFFKNPLNYKSQYFNYDESSNNKPATLRVESVLNEFPAGLISNQNSMLSMSMMISTLTELKYKEGDRTQINEFYKAENLTLDQATYLIFMANLHHFSRTHFGDDDLSDHFQNQAFELPESICKNEKE